MAAIFEDHFFLNLGRILYILWFKNFVEIALSSTVFKKLFFFWAKWPPLLATPNILKIGMGTPQRYPTCQIFRQNRSSTVLRYRNFCVLHFLRTFRKFKMAAIFDETEIFGKLGWLLRRDTLPVKNIVEIALSRILCFKIFAKNLKIQNGRHFC